MTGLEAYWTCVATILPVLALAIVIEIRLNFSRWLRVTPRPWLYKVLSTAVVVVWLAVAIYVEVAALELLRGANLDGWVVHPTWFVAAGLAIVTLYPVLDLLSPPVAMAFAYIRWIAIFGLYSYQTSRLRAEIQESRNRLATSRRAQATRELAVAVRGSKLTREFGSLDRAPEELRGAYETALRSAARHREPIDQDAKRIDELEGDVVERSTWLGYQRMDLRKDFRWHWNAWEDAAGGGSKG